MQYTVEPTHNVCIMITTPFYLTLKLSIIFLNTDMDPALIRQYRCVTSSVTPNVFPEIIDHNVKHFLHLKVNVKNIFYHYKVVLLYM